MSVQNSLATVKGTIGLDLFATGTQAHRLSKSLAYLVGSVESAPHTFTWSS